MRTMGAEMSAEDIVNLGDQISAAMITFQAYAESAVGVTKQFLTVSRHDNMEAYLLTNARKSEWKLKSILTEMDSDIRRKTTDLGKDLGEVEYHNEGKMVKHMRPEATNLAEKQKSIEQAIQKARRVNLLVSGHESESTIYLDAEQVIGLTLYTISLLACVSLYRSHHMGKKGVYAKKSKEGTQ